MGDPPPQLAIATESLAAVTEMNARSREEAAAAAAAAAEAAGRERALAQKLEEALAQV
jgi:hypothetical protein